MTKNYQAPKVVRTTDMNKAKGACANGSGDLIECMSGNGAMSACETGNGPEAECGPGNGPDGG